MSSRILESDVGAVNRVARSALARDLGLDLALIEIAQSKEYLTVRPAIGSHISLARTATGRAYLLSVSGDEIKRHVSGVAKLDRKQGAWMRKRLEEVRRDLDKADFA